MKKSLTLFSTLALACVLSAPLFAATSTKPVKAQTTTAAAKAAPAGKAHSKHSKKQRTEAGKKMGQTSKTTGQAAK